jgi:hypothetical protein
MTREQFRSLKAGDIVKVQYSHWDEEKWFFVLIEGNRCLGEMYNNLYETTGRILSSKVYREGIDWSLAESECASFELIA